MRFKRYKYPLVSVVIPTHGYPRYLSRAIRSALQYQGKNVEVIVVPNGPSGGWLEVVDEWRDDDRVVVSPIKTAHANSARNHGKSMAQGEYIRFLDHDDYLLPSAADQIDLLENSGIDICAGGIDIIKGEDKLLDVRRVPDTNDFVESILRPGHVTLPHAYLYRRSCILSLIWDENLAFGQDKDWVYKIAAHREYSFAYMDDAVGVWYQYEGDRISQKKSVGEHKKKWVQMVFNLMKILDEQGRVTEKRKAAATQFIWLLVFGTYFLDSTYWDEVIDKLNAFGFHERPNTSLYKGSKFTKFLPPRMYLKLTKPLKHCWRAKRLLWIRMGWVNSIMRP